MKNKIENRFKCPLKLWNKFSERGRIAYNNVRAWKQEFICPEFSGDKTEWECISHNFACAAAWEFKPNLYLYEAYNRKNRYLSSY